MLSKNKVTGRDKPGNDYLRKVNLDPKITERINRKNIIEMYKKMKQRDEKEIVDQINKAKVVSSSLKVL